MLRSFRFLSRIARRRRAVWLPVAVLIAIGCAPQRGGTVPPSHTTASAAAPAPSAAPAAVTMGDAELSRFVPKGATLRLSARGDLDGDGDEDALIAVESGSAESSNAPRALHLLRRGADGALQAAVHGPKAILCRRCGGMMGDPLQGIRIGRGGFTLRFEGGSRELWSSEYRFEYAPRRDGWLLAGIVFGGFDRADGSTVHRPVDPPDFGDVPLADFDPSDFQTDALP